MTARNPVGRVSQRLSVDVTQAPSITTPAAATFTDRTAGRFTIAAAGWPRPGLSVQGSLPPGLTFTDDANGTATLAGTPTEAGNYALNVTADNHVGAPTVQRLSVAVLLTPTTTKLSMRRTGGTASEATLALTAVVDPSAAVPTGRVTFRDRAAELGSAALDGHGSATLTVHVALGDHRLTASYDPSPGSGFAASTSAPFGYVATATPSRARGALATTGAPVRRSIAVGGALVVLGGAAAIAAGRIRCRRPRRPT